MRRYRSTGPIGGLALAATLACACADPPTGSAPPPERPELVVSTLNLLVLWPTSFELMTGEMQGLLSYDCPRDANGNPDVGPDGVPGTDDDLCEPRSLEYSVSPPELGDVDPPSSTSTVFTAGAEEGTGSVFGEDAVTGRTTSSTFTIADDSEPIGDGQKTIVCVQFTRDDDPVGEPQCRELPAAGGAVIAFTPGKDVRVTVDGGSEQPAPAGADGIFLVGFASGMVTRGHWITGGRPTTGQSPIVGIKGATTVELDFPEGSDGEITESTRWRDGKKIVPTDEEGNELDEKVNDIHISFLTSGA